MGLSCTGQTAKTDAAVLSRNESFFSLSLSLCGVLCAAEVFVVTQASDKASCSSWAKSRTSPQGPQVGVGSPAALCARFIIWKHTGRETDGDTHTHTHSLKLHISIYWPSGVALNSTLEFHQLSQYVAGMRRKKNGALAHEYFSCSCISDLLSVCFVGG